MISPIVIDYTDRYLSPFTFHLLPQNTLQRKDFRLKLPD